MPFTTLDSGSNLSPADADDLTRVAQWARIGAIIGAILIAVNILGGVLFGLFMKRFLTQFAPLLGSASGMLEPGTMSIAIIVISVLVSGVFVMPVVFLFQYAQRLRTAVRAGFDGAAFSNSLQAQRNLFTYSVILVGLMLGFALLWTAAVTFALLAPPIPPPVGYGM
jgi:hypothetical protein